MLKDMMWAAAICFVGGVLLGGFPQGLALGAFFFFVALVA